MPRARLISMLILAVLAWLSVGCSSNTAPRVGDADALLNPRGERVSLLETDAPVRSDAWYADRLDRGPGAYAGYESPRVTYSRVYTYDRLSSRRGNVVDDYRRTRRSVIIQDGVR